MDAPHKISFGVSAREAETLQSRIKVLTGDLKSAETELEKLQTESSTKLLQNAETIEKLQKEAIQLRETLEHTRDDHQRQLKELDVQKQQEAARLTQQRKDEADRLNRRAAELQETLAKAIADEKTSHNDLISRQRSEYESKLSGLKSQHESEMDELRTLSSEGLARNEPFLEAARKASEEKAALAETKYHTLVEEVQKERQATSKAADAKYERLFNDIQRERQQLTGDFNRISQEAEEHRRRANAAARIKDELQKVVDGRTDRATTDRSDYDEYQELYRNMSDSGQVLLYQTTHMRNMLQRESVLWRESSQRFQQAPGLKLFHHDPRYSSLKHNVTEYLKSRADQAQEAAQTVATAGGDMRSLLKDFKKDAHTSRSLTRHLHFAGNANQTRSMRLATYLSEIMPLQRRHDEETANIADLEQIIDSATGPRQEELKKQLSRAKDRRDRIDRNIKYQEEVRHGDELRAKLNFSPLEKRVLSRMQETWKRMLAISSKYHRVIETTTVHGVKERSQRLALRNAESQLHRELRSYERLIRRIGMYQEELNVKDFGAERQFDADVTVQLEESRRYAQRMLDIIVGKRENAAMTRRSRMHGPASPGVAKASPSDAGKSLAQKRSPSVGSRMPKSPKLQESQINISNETMAQQSVQAASEMANPETVHILRDAHFPAAVNATASSTAPQTRRSRRARLSARELKPSCEASLTVLKTNLNFPKTPGKLNITPTVPRTAHQPSWPCTLGGRRFFSASRAWRQNMRWSTLSHASEAATFPIPTENGGHIDPVLILDSAEAVVVGEEATSTLEPQTVLEYTIPANDYRQAVMTSPNSAAAFWSHTLYKSSKGSRVQVYYCRTLEVAERQLKLFLKEPVLGFDLEWEQHASGDKSSIKKNVSLVQLAAEDKIALIQVAAFKGETVDELMPPSLRTILENENIVKAGVNVAGDATRMRNHFNIHMRGVFELSHMYRVVKRPDNVNFKLVSLAEQVQNVLLLPLLKSDVRVSAWGRILNHQQTTYAAADAYAGFQLYHKLDNERKLMDPTPPRPANYETGKPIILGNGQAVKRSKVKPKPFSKETATCEGGPGKEDEEEDAFDAPEEIPNTYELGPLEAKAKATSDATPDQREFAEDVDAAVYPKLPPLQPQVVVPSVEASTAAKPPTATVPKPLSPIVPGRTQLKPQPLQNASTTIADEWIATNPNLGQHSRIGTSTLRAYHLWHHQSHSVQEVAKLCREPPLALTTVASYIMQAVREEGLEYRKERIKLVLEILPKTVWGAYWKIVKDVGL